MIDAKTIRELLNYDPQTGIFTWRPRGISSFDAREAGTVAGGGNGNGYSSITLRGHGGRYYAHHLAWLHFHGQWPSGVIDHINMNRADNRIANLRVANETQNRANTGRRRHNTSGFKGVSNCDGRWRAKIGVNRKSIHLGTFNTPEAAHEAYMAAARRHFGEFARSA
jgi:hypothetical protein